MSKATIKTVRPDGMRGPHRGYRVWVNGIVYRTVQYEGEAHGVVAHLRIKAVGSPFRPR